MKIARFDVMQHPCEFANRLASVEV